MANRSHVYRVLEDGSGVPSRNIVVTIKKVDGTPMTDPLFVTDTGGAVLANPFTTVDGSVEFYLNIPQRLLMQWRPPNAVQDAVAVVDAPEVPVVDIAGGTNVGIIPVATQVNTYTANVGELVPANTTGAPFSVTLPTLPTVGATVGVYKSDSSPNMLTILPAAGGSISGDPTATTITKNGGATFEHLGANAWSIVASYLTGGQVGPTGSAGPAGTGASPATTKGDLSGFSTASARIAVGADGTLLTADSTSALGVSYKTPAALAVPGGLVATGTPSATTFLRGDGSWQAPASGYNGTVFAFHISGSLTTGLKIPRFIVPNAMTINASLARMDVGSGATYQLYVNGASVTAGPVSAPVGVTVVQSAYTGLALNTGDVVQVFISSAGTSSSDLSVTVAATNAAIVTGTVTTSLVSYTPSTAIIANPRRGFIQYTETHYSATNTNYVPLLASDMTTARTGAVAVVSGGTTTGTFTARTNVFRYFYLEKYKVNGSVIDATYLALVDADLAAIQSAGCTARLRFAYDNTVQTTGPWTSDVNLATVQSHIQALAPTINKYATIVDSVDAGFIGTSGEWLYTSNFLTGTDPNALSAGDVTNRNAVINQLLTSLDTRIFINLRYLGERQAFLASTASNPGGANAARLGHHNDGFLADDGNYGTYATHFTFAAQTITQARAYLDGMARVPVHGESANVASPNTDWAPATSTWGGAAVELAQHHFSALNPGYYPQTIISWGQTNIDIAQRNLGYRLRMVSSTMPTTAVVNASVNVTLVIRNDGYTAPYRNRPVQIVWTNGGSIVRSVLAAIDVRTWAPGSDILVTGSVAVPSTPGTWQAALALPDPALTDVAQAIQTANTGTWDGTNGWNNLTQPLIVR